MTTLTLQFFNLILQVYLEIDKICTFWKTRIYLIMSNTKYDTLEQLYVFSITSCKRFHSKILSKKKKRTKKDYDPFTK